MKYYEITVNPLINSINVISHSSNPYGEYHTSKKRAITKFTEHSYRKINLYLNEIESSLGLIEKAKHL